MTSSNRLAHLVATPVLVVALVALAACGSSSKPTTAGNTPTSSSSGPAQKPCVKETGTAPQGAPAVPVVVGAAPTKLVTKDLKVGSGAVVPPGATVTVQYIGVACSTGKIFDSSYSRGQPATFPLTGVIKGWTDGIPGMRVGGMRLLGIPSADAYGAQGAGGDIGPNEALWFVVEVTNVSGSTTPSTAGATSAPDFKVDPAKTYTAKISTNLGDVTVTLDTKHAPIAAGHFIKLAQAGVYDHSKWHRVVKGFVIQGGAPGGDPTANYGHAVVGEVPTDNYPLGSIAAAKTQDDAPGTFDSQFFIMTDAQAGSQLPNDYARFGSVTGGMDVVRKIEALPVDANQTPTQAATIDKVTITES